MNSKFEMGQIIFLITDPDQNQRMITGWIVRPSGVVYYVTFGTLESCHYEIEIGTEKNWKV
jgi:hypothetical protein